MTVLNTDIEQPQKEDNKQNNKEQKKEQRNVLISTIIKIVCVVLLLAVIALFIIFGVKRCSKNNSSNSEPSSNEIYNNDQLNNIFKYLVSKKINKEGLGDQINSVITVTYSDNYPNNFSLNISGYNDNKIYYYEITDYSYPSNKEGYDNFVSYLLLNNNYQSLTGNINLGSINRDNYSVTTSKTSNKYVVGKSPTDKRFLFGYYLDNDSYYAYNNKLVEDNVDPFVSSPDLVINNQNLLYNYYQYLNK